MFNLNEGLIYFIDFSAQWQIYLTYIAFILITIVASYLLGSINSAIVVSKVLYGEDVRNHGSGNAGLTNMMRTYGKRAALFTLLGDMLKTALAILIAASFFGFHYVSGISYGDGYCYMAGLFAVLGHVFPIFYKFKGGKGVLVTSTMALILSPGVFAFLFICFVAIVAASKYVSLGSVTVAIFYPVAVSAYFKLLGIPTPGILILCTILLAIFIVWCHRANLQRISNRTENKFSFKSKKAEEAKAETEEPKEEKDDE